MCDIDLSILGETSERLLAYDRQIALEYAWVEKDVYRHKRGEVLAGFLKRPREISPHGLFPTTVTRSMPDATSGTSLSAFRTRWVRSHYWPRTHQQKSETDHNNS